jgi:hypothetical protein
VVVLHETGNGPRGHHPPEGRSEPNAQLTRAAEPDRNRPRPVAAAVAFPPTGRRHTWLVLVRKCPACGYAHAHRARNPGRIVGSGRTGSCGAAYLLGRGDAA